MTTFNVGDPVQITAGYCGYYGRVATVAEVADGRAFPYRVEGIELWRFADHEVSEPGSAP